jgi:hypothetical protein
MKVSDIQWKGTVIDFSYTDEEVKELAEGEYSMEVQTSYTESRFAEMTKGQVVEKIKGAWETLGKFH